MKKSAQIWNDEKLETYFSSKMGEKSYNAHGNSSSNDMTYVKKLFFCLLQLCFGFLQFFS